MLRAVRALAAPYWQLLLRVFLAAPSVPTAALVLHQATPNTDLAAAEAAALSTTTAHLVRHRLLLLAGQMVWIPPRYRPSPPGLQPPARCRR